MGTSVSDGGAKKHKWQSAFVAIYSARVLLFIYQNILAKRNLFRIDQKSLSELVREKNHDELKKRGGVDGVAECLNTSAEHGIHGGQEDACRRREAFGTNKPPRTRGITYYASEARRNLIMIITMLCGAVSLGLGLGFKDDSWVDGFGTLISVSVYISIYAFIKHRLNRRFDALSHARDSRYVDVLRDGKRQQIPGSEMLVGDVVHVKKGDQVPADGLFLEDRCYLVVDEWSIKGESDHIQVNRDQNPFLLSGTYLVDGNGLMLVTAVGTNTMISQLNQHIETPLQSRLDKLISRISNVNAIVNVLGFFAVWLIWAFTRRTAENTTDDNGNQSENTVILKMIIFGITMLMASLLDGLPLAVMLTVLYPLQRLTKENALMRKLSACETMGSATVVCTHKTGPLTLNQMEVTQFWLGKDSMQQPDSIAPTVKQLLQQGIAMNTTARVTNRGVNNNNNNNNEIEGSPTEKAILSWAIERLNLNMEELKGTCSVLRLEMFSSEKKRSGVLMKRTTMAEEENSISTTHVHWKGAAEMVLAMCSRYYDAFGEIKDIDDNQRMEFTNIIEGMAASKLHCIAFAHGQVEVAATEELEKNMLLKENGLVLLGLVGMKDECRPRVKQAVEDCKRAGVDVKMITGDHVLTAKAIATECGILCLDDEDEGALTEGEEFRNYTPEERSKKVDRIRVMARSLPSDKLLLVECLKEKGHVVAVTGDSTDDSPALKEADIGLGLSTDIQGTEVAEESTDIVILDNNFCSVVTVLKWGRGIYNNIQKFIQFQLTFSIANIVFDLVVAVSGVEIPFYFYTVQFLWLNLIVDIAGTLALATLSPTREVMHKPPVRHTDPFITNVMWRNISAQSLYQVSLLLTVYFRGKTIFHTDDDTLSTMVFNIFVLCQVFNKFNAREMEKKNVFKGVFNCRRFALIIAITIVLQVVMVEFLCKFASTKRLSLEHWGVCIFLASMTWPIDWVVKCIPVPEKPVFSSLKPRIVRIMDVEVKFVTF